MSKYYIDANKLLQELNEAQTEGDEYYKGLGKAKQILCEQPDANVEEVRIGKWLTDKFGMERAICSICGAVYEGGDGFRFCPKCGAKIEGVQGFGENYD